MRIQSFGSSLGSARLPASPKVSPFFGVGTPEPQSPIPSSSSPEEGTSDVDWDDVFEHTKARAESPSQKSSSISAATSQILDPDIFEDKPSPKGKGNEAPLTDQILDADKAAEALLKRKHDRKPSRKQSSGRAYRKWIANKVGTTADEVAKTLQERADRLEEESKNLRLRSGLTGKIPGIGSAGTSTVGKRDFEQLSLGDDNASRVSLIVDEEPTIIKKDNQLRPYPLYAIRVPGKQEPVGHFTLREKEVHDKLRTKKHRGKIFKSINQMVIALKEKFTPVKNYMDKYLAIQKKEPNIKRFYTQSVPQKTIAGGQTIPAHIEVGYDIPEEEVAEEEVAEQKTRKAKAGEPATS